MCDVFVRVVVFRYQELEKFLITTRFLGKICAQRSNGREGVFFTIVVSIMMFRQIYGTPIVTKYVFF